MDFNWLQNLNVKKKKTEQTGAVMKLKKIIIHFILYLLSKSATKGNVFYVYRIVRFKNNSANVDESFKYCS